MIIIIINASDHNFELSGSALCRTAAPPLVEFKSTGFLTDYEMSVILLDSA